MNCLQMSITFNAYGFEYRSTDRNAERELGLFIWQKILVSRFLIRAYPKIS
jgi:hypothetical protein